MLWTKIARNLRVAPLILALFAAPAALAEDAAAAEAGSSLREALLFHAPFDGGTEAAHAQGDPKLYTTPRWGAWDEGQAGLPEDEHVVLAPGEGRFGDALHFVSKQPPVLFYHGPENFAYTRENWSGAVSLWMRLNPEEDLEPGYSDPVQFVGDVWNEGAIFLEFTQENPRHFRYAIMAIRELWNPDGIGWEEMEDRPMIQMDGHPFSGDEWTHIVFTYENMNTGEKNGSASLYINGEYQGTFADREQTFGWDPEKTAFTLGMHYIGYLDDIAIFNRPLTAEEVRHVYALEDGIRSLE